MLQSVNPCTGLVIRQYREHTRAELESILDLAVSAQKKWELVAERSGPMFELASLLREEAKECARTMALEMGKPIAGGQAEIEKCAKVCEYYANHAAGFLADEIIVSDARESKVVYRPLGVVLGIMPWNFPFWQVFRFVAPALMAGNGAILKHAGNVSECSLLIERLVIRSGFPEGLFRSVLIPGSEAAELIADPRVCAVSLTGSTEAGRCVARVAGENMKKCVLELGGSDPYLVLGDADVSLAAEAAVTGRMINGGQSCIAAKRMIVVAEVHDAFVAAVMKRMEGYVTGDPLGANVTLGPLARADLRDELHNQVVSSIRQGAQCLLGGMIPDTPGFFYPPTILTRVRPGMPAFDEELFGPVAAIIVAENEDEAIELANRTVFGLGAAVFSRDIERAEIIARERIQAGSCFVNAFVRSDPRLPFGGIRESGYGRELSLAGIREFVNAKTIWIG